MRLCTNAWKRGERRTEEVVSTLGGVAGGGVVMVVQLLWCKLQTTACHTSIQVWKHRELRKKITVHSYWSNWDSTDPRYMGGGSDFANVTLGHHKGTCTLSESMSNRWGYTRPLMYPGYIDVPPETFRKIGNSYSVTVYTTDFVYSHIYIYKTFAVWNMYVIHKYFIYKFCLFEPVEEVRATV